jgi:hypothetical protein
LTTSAQSAAPEASIELGDVAAKARPKLLVLYYRIPAGVTDRQLIGEVESRYTSRESHAGQ